MKRFLAEDAEHAEIFIPLRPLRTLRETKKLRGEKQDS